MKLISRVRERHSRAHRYTEENPVCVYFVCVFFWCLLKPLIYDALKTGKHDNTKRAMVCVTMFMVICSEGLFVLYVRLC